VRFFSFFFILLLLSFHIKAQSYFQQQLTYNIHVRLDTVANTLSGNLKLNYTNHSPDTLTCIYFHLYPNATRSNTQTAFAKQKLQHNDYSFYNTPESKYGSMDSLAFTVDNQTARFLVLKDSLDIGILYLNKPLLPQQSIVIETHFYVKIPYAGIMRMGYIDGLYGITQWYPKPAVYDQYGWHPYPYLDEGEYYGEFGKFDVYITVPSNYTVAATGILFNQKEAERIKKIETLSKNGIWYPDTTSGEKELHFAQDSIHDFAWFASSYFMIAHDSVTIKDKTVHTWAYYTPYSFNLWKDAAKYVWQSVKYYSEMVGTYPYRVCTAVETPYICSGGMEYPTITSIGLYNNAKSLFNVILHEVGHNWFYGMLASNERNNPWIDEGINTFYESMFYPKKINKKQDWQKLFDMINQVDFPQTALVNYFYYAGMARPLGLKSENFGKAQYFVNAYYNGASTWYIMREYLGADTFDLAMKNLFAKYSFRHIYPEDIQHAIADVTSKPTSWFFDDYLNSTHRSDYIIKKIISSNDSIYVTIKNKKKTAFPFKLSFYKKDSLKYSTVLNGWHNQHTFSIPFSQPFTKAIINDDELFYEHNYNNNVYHLRKILPHMKGLSIRYVGITDYNQKYDVLLSPIAAYNAFDKYMLGCVLYAPQIPYPTFQIRAVPLYSFAQNKFNGSFYMEKNILLNNIVPYIRLFGLAETYSLPQNEFKKAWQKITTGVEIPFEYIHQLQQWNAHLYSNVNYTTYPFEPYSEYWYNNTGFTINKTINIFQTRVSMDVETGDEYSKLKLKAHLFFPYFKKKGFDADYFWGVFLYNRSRLAVYNFFLSGIDGIKDYLYDDVFIDRFHAFNDNVLWTHQFILSDGLFTTYVPLQSNRWMTSLRTSLALPIPPPFYLYGTVGTYYRAGKAFENSFIFPWEFGFEIRIIKNIFAVYFPLTMSSDIKQLSDFNSSSYFNKIRFMLRFSLMNPFKYTDKIPSFFE